MMVMSTKIGFDDSKVCHGHDTLHFGTKQHQRQQRCDHAVFQKRHIRYILKDAERDSVALMAGRAAAIKKAKEATKDSARTSKCSEATSLGGGRRGMDMKLQLGSSAMLCCAQLGQLQKQKM
jgi:hypothetical protein